MKILITGGTGFLARYLIPALQERGDAVRALALPGEDVTQLQARGVAVSRGDVRKQETLSRPMGGMDCVFHLAALMGPWRPMRDYYAVNVTGTENVCREALKAGVRRLIHISSWTVYGMNLADPVDEETPLKPLKEPYAVTKAAGDELVRRMIAQEGLPAVIIRPGTIFGPGDRLNFGRIADGLRRHGWITVGSGENALPFVYVTDVVQGLLLALDAERALGHAYNITNDRPLTQQEAWRAIADEIGARPPRIHVPYGLLCAVAYVSERIGMLGNYRFDPLVTRHGVMLFGGDNRHSIEKSKRELGYSPRVSLREGIRVTGAWYRAEHPVAAPALAPPALHRDIEASTKLR